MYITSNYDEVYKSYGDDDESFLRHLMWNESNFAKIVEKGAEEVEHKMVSREYIFKMNSDGRTFRFYHTKENSGYWSDSDYDEIDTDVEEVELKEVVIKKWVKKEI